MQQELPPVITIDGPSGSGKGTVSQMLARKLGWHFLDSGAVYRAAAWGVMHYQIDIENEAALIDIVHRLKIKMIADKELETKIFVDNHDVTDKIRHQTCSQMASKIAAIAKVRKALLKLQRDMRLPPGLVTDGRDMGTVVFPDAQLKFFLIASAQERAQRRYKQLKAKGIDVSLRTITQELKERDERDCNRAIAPAKPAEDVVLIDTTAMTVEQVFAKIMEHVRKHV